MSLFGDGERAMYQFLSTHTALTDLLVGGVDGIVHKIPQRILQPPYGDDTPVFDEEDFPIVTYHGISNLEEGHGFGDVTVEVNIFVHPEGSNGGENKLDEIDGVIGTRLRGNGLGAVFIYDPAGANKRVGIKTGMTSRGFPLWTDVLRRGRTVRMGF